LVEGNFCHNNVYAPTGVNDAGDIALRENAAFGKVTGNVLRNCQTGATAGFGIYLWSCNWVQVSDNFFYDSQPTKSMAGAIGGTTGSNNTISGNHYGAVIGAADQLTYGSGSMQGISIDVFHSQQVGTLQTTGVLGVGGTTGPTWTTGSAAPAATAPVGSLYSRVGGAVGATLYVSRGGGTWAAIAGV
jgi:hypothetical protein